jgi:hypothetical protein
VNHRAAGLALILALALAGADGKLVIEGKLMAFLDQEVVGRVMRT